MTTLQAPAKLTLSLAITGIRDDGFHLISSEMVSLDLCDVIRIVPASRNTITVDGPFAAGVPTDATNLMHKALDMAGVTASIHLTKNIPRGGGLGGGSTDAAAVLRWAGWTDLTAAARVGADIAFCMVGGRADVGGIGEVVRPLSYERRDFTLVIPPVHVSTPLVYRTWDDMGGPEGDNGNDLEPAALVAEPKLVEWRDRITAAAGRRPSLAGSGATWFLEGHHDGIGTELEGATVVLTSTRPDAGRVDDNS